MAREMDGAGTGHVLDTWDNPISDDRYLGDELICSIATGAGWLLAEADERQLMQLEAGRKI